MKHVSLCCFFSLLICLFIVCPAFASAPQIIASPSGTVQLDQAFTLSATMSGLSKNAVYRLRIAIFQPDTTNYFGSTWNGGMWYNGTPPPITYAYFLSVTTDGAGSWSGDIQGKIDPDDPSFTTGSGVYGLKIGRYTQTGSSATWSDPVFITIFAPDPTPLPPTPTPSPLPTSVPTQKPPALIPKTPIPTAKTTPKITYSPSIAASLATIGAVLGTESARKIATPSAKTIVARSFQKKPPVIFLLLGSIIVLAAAGISGWFMYKQKYNGTLRDNDKQ